MDRVKLGRALGYGARHAVKAMTQAAEAAAAPTPKSAPRAAPQARPAAQPTPTARPRVSVQQVRQAARRSRGSFWSPLAKFSSVLWLQVTGCFFAVVAVFLAQGAWRLRSAGQLAVAGQWRSHALLQLVVVSGASLLFAYLAVSNFVRAARRDRR